MIIIKDKKILKFKKNFFEALNVLSITDSLANLKMIFFLINMLKHQSFLSYKRLKKKNFS